LLLSRRRGQGEKRASFKVLLGTLYYKVGNDEKAATLLREALDDLSDLEQRSAVCRTLGNLYLRQGKRDEAIAVWKRIAELNPQEIFSQLELAEIYEDNRMWDEAIAVYRRIADVSKEDAYRKCRALRSIGQCLIQSEKFKDAIVAFEQALELVAPGNWLFEDIKMRLVSVYEDIGDLDSLTKYLLAKLEQSPGDIEFRELLAETYTRMAKFDLAEKEYQTLLDRNPRSSSIREKLITLYARTDKKTSWSPLTKS
jgi:tetratricopeptide (TPR) repeat protein